MTHINPFYMPTLLGAALLLVKGQGDARRAHNKNQIAISLLFGFIFAVPALLFAAYYTHLFDRAGWFYSLRSRPGIEMTAMGLGFSAGLLAEFARRQPTVRDSRLWRPLIPAMLILLVGGIIFVPYIKPLLSPLQTPLQSRWSNGVCLQSTPSTCGPSSAATILHQFGIPASERELAEECYSYSGGTENWYVARALRKRGLKTEYLMTAPQPATLPYPSIAGVKLGGENGGGGHFITVLSQQNNRYIVGDPLVGKLTLTKEQLMARYYFTGFFLKAYRP